jgi:hypothetical protein
MAAEVRERMSPYLQAVSVADIAFAANLMRSRPFDYAMSTYAGSLFPEPSKMQNQVVIWR